MHFKSLLFFVALFLYLITPITTFPQQTVSLRGDVTDAQTNEPLAAANVRVDGTARGTITNTQGNFILALPPAFYTIIVSYLAYQPETVRVNLSADLAIDLRLVPSPVNLPEVVVLAEDPALEIIRKAIANKRKWMDRLRTYRFDAFTRQVLYRDTAIAGITESYTTGYMTTGDTIREVIRQKRQTQNIPMEENMAAVRRIVNFNEDEISLFSIRMAGNSQSGVYVGPTAPDALNNYDYKLLRTSMMNDVEVYEIRMTPKTRLKPLFNGTVMIADETFAVMGVDVKPNEAFILPFVKDVNLRYRQQFALYDSIFWMPTDIRINGGFSVSIVGFSLPRIGIDQTSAIYDYEINAEVPDSVLAKRRLTVDSASVAAFDSSFWQNNQVLPLTEREQVAYSSLDSTETLEKQFRPGGPLGALARDDNGPGVEGILGLAKLRFNRVEGLYLGGEKTVDSLIPLTRLTVGGGYGFSDKVWKYGGGATIFPLKSRMLGIEVEVYKKLDHVSDGGYYGDMAISLMSLMNKNDYRDYFLVKGWSASLSSEPTRRFFVEAGFVNEEHFSVSAMTDYSFFSRNKSYRLNPPIQDGNLRALQVRARVGRARVPLDIVTQDALEFEVEHSSPSLVNSDFGFTRYAGTLTLSIPTFARTLFFPPNLRLRLSAGSAGGTLPPQRYFTIDTRGTVYAPFGVVKGGRIKEFGGDAFVMLNVEHNFRSIPFLALNIPLLYRNGIELVTHASVAQSWLGNISTTDGWYAESGIGVSRIFDLLRFDVTYRFKEPRRFWFSASLANFF